MQYRHEYKYNINYLDYLTVKSRLEAVMTKDPHIGPDGRYRIRSLYFDDMEDSAYHEKNDGLSRRKKFRIRMYDGDDSFIRLEKKVKVSGLGTKIAAPLTREETQAIIDGDIAWMAADERDLVRELYMRMQYDGLKPKVLVDYTREPYIYGPGNVRVTLDSDIRSGGNITDFFDSSLPMIDVADGAIVMEVKYDNFLPEIVRDITQMQNRQLGAFSKYAACRRFTI